MSILGVSVLGFLPFVGILKEAKQCPSGLDVCQLHRLSVIDDNIILIPTGRNVMGEPNKRCGLLELVNPITLRKLA